MVSIHPCENCPEIQSQINWKWFDEHDHTEDDVDETILSCRCDKLDGLRIRWSNARGCDDYENNYNRKPKQRNNKKRLNKREREEKYHYKLKRMSVNQGYPCPVTWVDEKWVRGQGYVHVSKPYYKRRYRGNASKYYKKYSNRVVRRYKGDIPKRGGYRKCFDYCWEIN